MTDAPATEGQATAPEGQGQAPWYRNEAFGFADEEIGAIENKGWKESPKQILSAYQNLEKFHGVPAEQLIKLPKEKTPEAMVDVYTKLGRPESPEKYGDVQLPDTLKDAALDEGRLKWADSLAHKIGLNKAQRDALITETVGFERQAMQEMIQAQEQEAQIKLEALHKKWGPAKPEREELARRAFKSFFGEEAADKLDDMLGAAAVVEAMAKIGEGMKEDKIPGNDSDRPYGMTPEMAKAQLADFKKEISADPKRLADYNNGIGPDKEKMERLQKIAYA